MTEKVIKIKALRDHHKAKLEELTKLYDEYPIGEISEQMDIHYSKAMDLHKHSYNTAVKCLAILERIE